MSLPPGSRLGVYEVISLIGRGGMGEVYRARDTRLQRDVALKALPDGVAADRERLERFEREARVLASLSHPNIAVIHGLGEEEAAEPGRSHVTALVMELVEGETLEDRLRRGPLPLDEALYVVGQIADALDAAHQKGIVHRDLKPANVKITPGGVVKVLDFGLAKILAEASPDGVTLAGTGPAVILGTPAYMAPEQAQGRSADTRVDIWAFGVVLYELVTGDRLFRRESLQDTLAAVLTTEPHWERVPPPVRPLLRACLERTPRKRLRDIGDYRFLIGQSSEATAPPVRPSRLAGSLLALGALAGVLLAFVAGKSIARNGPDPAPAEPIRLSTMLPVGVSVTRGPGYTSSVAVSPDGRTLVIAGSNKDGQRLYRRPLDRLEPSPLGGTERGSSPFFSRDGAWIGFFADGRLKRIPAEGGAAVDIAAAPGFPAGASWGPDDRIVFAYGADSLLHVVSAQGGNAEPLTENVAGRHPEVLPDGRTVLFESAGWIHAFDRQAAQSTRIVQGTAPRYAAGHVILSRGTTLLAAPIDLARYELTRPLFPLVEGVAVELPGSGGGRHYAISNSGALVYVPAAEAYALVVVDADGLEHPVAEQRSFENPRFSPDGRLVVVATTRRADEPADLWVHDLRTGTATRLTFNGGRAPIWTHDGRSVAYSHPGERRGIYSKPADGRGDARQLLPLDSFHWLVGWTRDRPTLAYGVMEKTQSSIVSHTDSGSHRVVGPGSTWGGRLSRDGRWLTYYVLERGTFEVRVTPFPEGGAGWLIAEGTDPTWGPDGSEVYYRSGPRLMAARIDKTAGVKVLSRRVVIDPFLPPLYDDYDIHPDGRTLVLVRPANQTQGREVTMVLNWSEEFRRADR